MSAPKDQAQAIFFKLLAKLTRRSPTKARTVPAVLATSCEMDSRSGVIKISEKPISIMNHFTPCLCAEPAVLSRPNAVGEKTIERTWRKL